MADVDSGIERARARAAEAISIEVDALEKWVRDPNARVTRTDLLARIETLRSEVTGALDKVAAEANSRMYDYDSERVEEALKLKQESEERFEDLRKTYECALRVLEDAGVDERDLIGVENQIDPIRILVSQQKRRRA